MKREDHELLTLFNTYADEARFTHRLRPASIRGYRDVLMNFLKRVPEVSTLSELSPKSVTLFYKRLSENTSEHQAGVKTSTLHTYYNKLRAFFSWLENRGHLQKGQITAEMIKPSRPRYEDKRAFTDAEVRHIASTIRISTLHSDFQQSRDLALFYTFLYTGVRRGECLAIRLVHLDLKNKEVYIEARTSKSKKGRVIPLHPTLCLYLKNYLELRRERNYFNEYLFVSCRVDQAFTVHGLKHWVQRYKALSNVHIHVHRFRHHFACALNAAGADIVSIKELLGHASIEMTMRYLRSVSKEHVRSCVMNLSF